MDSPRDESAACKGRRAVRRRVLRGGYLYSKNVVFHCGFDGRNGTELRG